MLENRLTKEISAQPHCFSSSYYFHIILALHPCISSPVKASWASGRRPCQGGARCWVKNYVSWMWGGPRLGLVLILWLLVAEGPWGGCPCWCCPSLMVLGRDRTTCSAIKPGVALEYCLLSVCCLLWCSPSSALRHLTSTRSAESLPKKQQHPGKQKGIKRKIPTQKNMR